MRLSQPVNGRTQIRGHNDQVPFACKRVPKDISHERIGNEKEDRFVGSGEICHVEGQIDYRRYRVAQVRRLLTTARAMTGEQFQQFLVATFTNWRRIAKPGASMYVCHVRQQANSHASFL